MSNTFIYCPKPDEQLRLLAKGLGANVLRSFDGMNFWEKGRRYSLAENDAVVCWGEPVPELDGIRVLNALANPVGIKEVSFKLERAGVHTTGYITDQSPKTMEPYRKDGSYVARDYAHKDGDDLLFGAKKMEFWTRKDNIIEEYRIHSFNGRSIRAGIKVPIPGYPKASQYGWGPGAIHPWVRTALGGWQIDYSEFRSTAPLRQLAHKASKIMGLTFSCVDIGRMAVDGPNGLPQYSVLGVRTIPDLPDQLTVDTYVKCIAGWLAGDIKALKPGADVDEFPF